MNNGFESKEKLHGTSKCRYSRPSVHHDRDMIIHIAVDIPEETCRDDTHGAKGDADEIDILVALRIRRLAGREDDGVCGFVPGDSGDGF